MDGERGGAVVIDAGEVQGASRRRVGAYDPTQPPTQQQYEAFAAAFDYFNALLFGERLPSVLMTFCKKGKARGFFASDRWAPASNDNATKVHEISLNPDQLGREPHAVASTIVHEMVHLWQHAFGTPSRRGYHNSEWANKMEAIGLMPSTTGLEGGKRTGQSVTHYIIGGGPFDVAWSGFRHETLLPLIAGEPSRAEAGRRSRQLASKTKLTCPLCNRNVWGKPDTLVSCVPCGEIMRQSGGGAESDCSTRAPLCGALVCKVRETNDPEIDHKL